MMHCFFLFFFADEIFRDEVTAHWEKTRHTMTQEFKRKHKSASRNKARATKRFKSNQHGDGHEG